MAWPIMSNADTDKRILFIVKEYWTDDITCFRTLEKCGFKYDEDGVIFGHQSWWIWGN